MNELRSCVNLTGICLASLWIGCGNVDEPIGRLDLRQGKKQFETYCAACHQIGGTGIESRVPPLTGSPWVAGSESRLIRIVLHGLRGPIEIAGKTYNLEMPGFGMAFEDAEIAAMLSYVRQRYGEPNSPITAKMVSRVRAATKDRTSYWTVDELLDAP